MIEDIFLEEAKKQGYPEQFFAFTKKEHTNWLAYSRPTPKVLTHFLRTGKMQGLPLFTITLTPASDKISFPAKQGLVAREIIHIEKYLNANRKPMLKHAYKYNSFHLTKKLYKSYIRDITHVIDLTIANEDKLAQIWMLRKEHEELIENNLCTATYNFAYPKTSLLEKMFDEPELIQMHVNHYKSLLGVDDARNLLK